MVTGLSPDALSVSVKSMVLEVTCNVVKAVSGKYLRLYCPEEYTPVVFE